jgi:D-alanyl-D-alanine carboxypeptidase/D-alanyl-D-alanine-endopeptidase (penicillin-binding protein 4)
LQNGLDATNMDLVRFRLTALLLVGMLGASAVPVQAQRPAPPRKRAAGPKRGAEKAVGRDRRARGSAQGRAAVHKAERHEGEAAARPAPPKEGSLPNGRQGRELPESPTVAAPRPAGDPGDPREARIAELRERLTQVLHERPLSRTRVGVEVVDAGDGDVLFSYNADKLFNPASNTKILTTAAALSQLGSDYRYRTSLHGPEADAAGVVHGDVELRGSGDPSLGTVGIADLARATAAAGVTRIEGDVLADGRYRDAEQRDAALGEGALIFNRNVYTVHVQPTEPKHVAAVDIEFSAPDLFVVDNKVVTVTGKRTRISVDLARARDGRLVVITRGRINARSDTRIRRRLGDGSLSAAATLRRALADFGVEVTGGVRRGGLASDAPLLAEHRSAPLADICRVSNKDSNNFVAESIFKTLARERFGAPATPAKGARAVGDLLHPLGISSYKVVNGSGLTHENRIQPSALARLLRHLYLDLSVAPEFLTSLAIGGIDGTIRNRFTSSDSIGRVRAKTGTLSGVSALSGYAGETGGVLVFSILVENFTHRRLDEVRQAQVRLVREMLAYLRANKPIRTLPTIVVPDETGGDSDADVSDDDPGFTGGN